MRDDTRMNPPDPGGSGGAGASQRNGRPWRGTMPKGRVPGSASPEIEILPA